LSEEGRSYGVGNRTWGSPGSFLQFRFERNREAETLYLSGELDVASPAALERTVDSALDRQGREFRLDVSALTFMDSTGAEALLRLHRRAGSFGRRLVVASPTRSASRVLEILGLDQVLHVER
jgi:anti-sigma B factor antagonist